MKIFYQEKMKFFFLLSIRLFRLIPMISARISLIRVNLVMVSSSAVLFNSARVESISEIVSDTTDTINKYH